MKLLSRALVGLIGILSLVSIRPHWFNLESLIAGRGIQAVDMIGRANIRADIGGIFLGIGLFSLLAAIRQSRHWLLAATLLTGGALLGRFVSLVLDGYSTRVGPPILIEVCVITIYLFALRVWKKAPEGL